MAKKTNLTAIAVIVVVIMSAGILFQYLALPGILESNSQAAFSNDIDYLVYQDTAQTTDTALETAIIRPNGNHAPNEWTGSYHYNAVKEVVTYPSTVVDDWNVASSVAGEKEGFIFQTIENIKEVKSITLWFYEYMTVNANSPNFKTSFDSTVHTISGTNVGYVWKSYEYTDLSLTQDELDDIWVDFEISSDNMHIIHAVYLQVKYIPETFASGVIDWSSDAETEIVSWGETNAGIIITKLSTKLYITGITSSSDIVDCQYFETDELRGILVSRGGEVENENIYFIIELEANEFDTDYDIDYGDINTISYSLSYTTDSVNLVLTLENTITMTPKVV